MRERVEFILFWCVRRLVLSLPLKSAQRLGSYLGSAAFYLIGSRRAITLDNLRRAFPEKSEKEIRAIARGAFCSYGTALMEFMWFPNLNEERIRKLVTIPDDRPLFEAHSRGKGVIVLAGHFGNWELIAFGGAYLLKLPFTIIVQTQSNKRVDAVINAHRCRLGNRVVPMGMSIREIIRTLSNGGIIAIAPDQSGPMEGVFVEFFGRLVATHQGPAAFALRSKSPLMMGFIIRQADGTYEVKMEEIVFSDLKEYNDENIIELTRRHAALLESYIRQYPEQWLWMHRRWKHTLESVQEQNLTSTNTRA